MTMREENRRYSNCIEAQATSHGKALESCTFLWIVYIEIFDRQARMYWNWVYCARYEQQQAAKNRQNLNVLLKISRPRGRSKPLIGRRRVYV